MNKLKLANRLRLKKYGWEKKNKNKNKTAKQRNKNLRPTGIRTSDHLHAKSTPCLMRHVTRFYTAMFLSLNGVRYRLPISDFSHTLTHFIAFEKYMANFVCKS